MTRRKWIVLVGVVAAPIIAHWTIGRATAIHPPTVALPNEAVDERDGARWSGPAWTRTWGGIREAYLEGTPEELGARNARVLGDRMAADDDTVWATFEHFVPLGVIRTLIMDVSKVRYRNIEANVPEARRRELAAAAEAVQPDPNASRMPTYERVVFLHSVYDIALSFEHSPLIGCSAFGLGPKATKDGHVLVGRAFDMEIGDVFDSDKVVYFVREDGMIPYASVAWPGLTGVVTGMNLEGVMVLVNGARAGEPRTTGMPVVFSLRETLQSAHTTEEAIDVLSKQDVMVSHIDLVVGDNAGQRSFAVVERALPGNAALQGAAAQTSPMPIASRSPTTSRARRRTIRRTSPSASTRPPSPVAPASTRCSPASGPRPPTCARRSTCCAITRARAVP